MPGDPFYRTPIWAALRKARLRLDGYACVVPGCGATAVVVDHVIPRKQGGPDTVQNLRSLCRLHDGQIKERPGGSKRGRGGQPVIGCDVSGHSLDPNHPFYRGGTKRPLP